MRAMREAVISGRRVVISELTLGDIRAWMASVQEGATDVVDALLFEDFDPDALIRMTDLSREDLNEMTPSELTELAAVCREVNQDFFAMRLRMVSVQRTMLAGISNATL